MTQPVPESATVDALQSVAEAGADLLDFEIASVSLALHDQVLETVAVAGSETARARLLRRQVSVVHVEDELTRGVEWGGLCFVPYERRREQAGGVAWVPDLTVTGEPGAWHPLDLLVAPIRDDGGLLRGLLHFDLPRDRRHPDLSEVERLTRFSDRARSKVLTAIEQAHLAERVRLADAARSIVRRASSELSVDRIIEVCQPAMSSGFDAVGMWMQTVDEDGGWTDVVHGATEGEIQIPDELKVLSRMAAAQLWEAQSVAVATDRIDPPIQGLPADQEQRIYDFMTTTLEATSMLFVPLGAGRECLGNLALTRRGDTLGWSEPEKQAALDIGHDLGRALLNARTFERERRLAIELSELDVYKSRLVATIAHELKNPLTTVVGHVEMLDSVPGLADPVRRSIDSIERGATRMQSTIEDLLRLAEAGDSRQPFTPVPVDLATLVHDVIDLLGVTIASKELKVCLDSATSPALAWGEVSSLDLVCTNLIGNAVKYTPPGGSVTVTLAQAGDEVELAVSDTGLGVAEKDQDQLFEEFFRSTNPAAVAEPGTGLGLAIVQRVVDRHGGRIRFDSTLGVGTTFVVTLPAALGAAPR